GRNRQARVRRVDAVSEREVAGQDPGCEPGHEQADEDPDCLEYAPARRLRRPWWPRACRRAAERAGLLTAEARHLAPATSALVDAVGLLLLGHPAVNVAGPRAGTARAPAGASYRRRPWPRSGRSAWTSAGRRSSSAWSSGTGRSSASSGGSHLSSRRMP